MNSQIKSVICICAWLIATIGFSSFARADDTAPVGSKQNPDEQPMA